MEFLIIIICCIFLICLTYLYNKINKNKRLKTCCNLFSEYPLYTRWLICRYLKDDKRRKNTKIPSFIKNYKMIVDKNIISDEIPSDLISHLFEKNIDVNKARKIENRLKVILDLYNLYPRAISVIYRYSSLSMCRQSLNNPYSIEEIFSLNDTEIIHQKLDTNELQSIETSIDNIFRLDNKMFNINPIKKDAKSIIAILKTFGKQYLYHITHKENLKQIKELGGLYSWVKLEEMKRPCQHPGSSSLSRRLDVMYGVADYVHLSYEPEHPMFYRKEKDMVVLLIHPIVCLLPDTLFSNMNATDKDRQIGPDLEYLKKVNFYASHPMLKGSPIAFKLKQAEVLVKSFIPSEYIINLYYAN